MRNLAIKVSADLWPEFKARVTACYQAPSRASHVNRLRDVYVLLGELGVTIGRRGERDPHLSARGSKCVPQDQALPKRLASAQ